MWFNGLDWGRAASGWNSCRIQKATICVIVFLVCFLFESSASAFEIDTGSDVKIRWDTTFKYSVSTRIGGQSADLVSDPNKDDGDRNFDRGIVSNRGDIFSEFDLTYRNVGLHASGAAWYDLVYNKSNNNDSPATVNSFNTPYNEFTNDTRDLMGRYVELLDLFAFANGKIGDQPWTLRAGRHTLLWGETLLLAGNGILNGQAPIDLIKLLQVPSTTAKELFMPVTQISGQIEPFKNVTLMGFYQFEWRNSRIPAAGSYLSDIDLLDKGGERLLLAPAPFPGAAFFRGDDLDAKNSGQWGVATRFRPPGLDVDFGLYFLNWHDKLPQLYVRPGLVNTPGGPLVIDPSVVNLAIGQVGTYFTVYPENIQALGASFSTQIGPANVAGEVHMRWNMPLISTPQAVLPGEAADNDDNPLYAVGKTLHANLSTVYLLPPTILWQGGNLLGEIGWNRLLSTTKNPAAIDPTRTRDAYGFRFVLEPAYYQVLQGWDLTVPLGFGYNPSGKSSMVQKFNGGADQGGDFSIGMTATYLNAWKFTLTYQNYFGNTNSQTLADRDFIAFSVSRTI